MVSDQHPALRAAKRRKISTTNIIHAAIIGCSAAAGVGIVAGVASLYDPAVGQSETVRSSGSAEAAPVMAQAAPVPSTETVAAITIAATPPKVEAYASMDAAVRPFSAADLQPGSPPIDRVAQAHAVQEAETQASTELAAEPPPVVQAPMVTGALAYAEPVEVAETPEEIAALEAQMAAAGAEFFKLAPELKPAEASEQAAIAPRTSEQGSRKNGPALPVAWTNSWVNMRAGPDNDARTITIVPSGSEIRAEADCRHWCRVAFDGQDGYIYKSFIRRE